MIDSILQHMESIVITVISAAGVAWGVVRWGWSHVDGRIENIEGGVASNSEDIDAMQEEATLVRSKVGQNAEQLKKTTEDAQRYRNESRSEYKELSREMSDVQQTVSALPSRREFHQRLDRIEDKIDKQDGS